MNTHNSESTPPHSLPILTLQPDESTMSTLLVDKLLIHVVRAMPQLIEWNVYSFGLKSSEYSGK